MANDREELQNLRELDRIQELEAKAGGSLSTASSTSPTHSTPGQAALEGFGETASMGYLPQLQALASKPIYGALNAATGQDVQPGSYLEERDSNIARQRQLSQDNPVASGLGKLGGIAATAPLMASGAGEAGVGAQALQGAKTGALMGAAYNPGDKEGEVDPLQLASRGSNAATGGAVGGLLGLLGGLVSKGSNTQQTINKVKDSANLSSSVKEEIDQALQDVNKNEVAPKAQALKEYLEGKNVDINVDNIKDTFPNLAKSLEKRADDAGRVSLEGPRALKLRQALDSAAGYKDRALFDPVAASKSDVARRGADILRSKLSDLGPEVDELNSGMAKAINASKSLARSSKRTPIASITGSPGTDKGSLIDLIDQMAGSHLEKTSQGIKSAQGLLLNPINLVKPLELPNELRKIAQRGLIKASDVGSKLAPEGAKESLLQGLFETKR